MRAGSLTLGFWVELPQEIRGGDACTSTDIFARQIAIPPPVPRRLKEHPRTELLKGGYDIILIFYPTD